ncbi:MAG: LysR substrate-binding domain-containing protein [Pseudomonadota bacterium]
MSSPDRSNAGSGERTVRSRPPERKATPPFEALRAFDAVARLGGIRRAAQALARDHAVISRHLRTLEDWTGTRLVERTAAGAMLTEEGRHYHAQIGRAIDDIADATRGLIKQGIENHIQVWCMPGFALHWLVEHLAQFEALYPGIDVELKSTHDGADLTRMEADIDIRLLPQDASTETPFPGVRGTEFAKPPIIPVASPEFLENQPTIESPEDLLKVDLLHEEDFDSWRVWLDEFDIEDAEPHGPRLWDGHMTLAAARQGRGVALTNRLVAAPDLSAGYLVEIGAGNAEFGPVTPWTYWFFARVDRWNNPSLKRFREWLFKAVREDIDQLNTPVG